MSLQCNGDGKFDANTGDFGENIITNNASNMGKQLDRKE